MRLTTKSEYSLLALLYLVRNQERGLVTLERISEDCLIPAKYLEQLLSVLKQSRYVAARRGSGGGYRLARDPASVSVAEIVRLMDGALAPTESVSRFFFSHTPLEREEKLLAVFKEIRDYISDRLERLTLADLV